MYCPRCAVHNDLNSKFCRSCGADISLVPDAVFGQLSERLAAAESANPGARPAGPKRPCLEKAVRSIFMGVAFILIALSLRLLTNGADDWWFWLFIPAAAMLGNGVATYMRVKEERRLLAPPSFVPAQASMPTARLGELTPPRDTGQMVRPPSVTEGTTRHLGVPVERRPKES